LPDKIGGEGSLTERLAKATELLDPVWRNEIILAPVSLWPSEFKPHTDRTKVAFQLGFLGRMIFSCLIDADRRDTESFCARHEGWLPDREWPKLSQAVDSLIDKLDRHMSGLRAAVPDSDVNRLRAEILDHVRAQSSIQKGLFTLTVPTGGGKTLTSLSFALEHARTHDLKRIIYAIPFTSIVDQTASIFRSILGNEMVLEHHSAIEDERREWANKDERSAKCKLWLAMEDWAAPVIVTTNVQLFESLFAARPSRCRKLHNLARSVIVLDEAQTIPLPYLRPCVAALDELARNYGASIILCTATQPALDERHFKPGGLKLEGRELAPEPTRLAKELKRVQIHFGGEMNDEALVDALSAEEQGLIIVNSRGHALSLFRNVESAGLVHRRIHSLHFEASPKANECVKRCTSNLLILVQFTTRTLDLRACRECESSVCVTALADAIHLTTRQYAAHRRIILANVRERLAGGKSCRLIATSLVEAGVDLDFPRVRRAQAGLDQIAQAAGRCNREGKRLLEQSIVTIFKAPDNQPPREIEQLSADFAHMADKHTDLISPEAIETHFREVYWRKGEDLDAKKILKDFVLSAGETSFAYRCVAEKFRMIESGLACDRRPGRESEGCAGKAPLPRHLARRRCARPPALHRAGAAKSTAPSDCQRACELRETGNIWRSVCGLKDRSALQG
jgi:CRISPR-associated endonuclease/helicase Cas3